jgi:hypothetical protein
MAKKQRTAKQKAATRKMIAANRARHGHHKPGPKKASHGKTRKSSKRSGGHPKRRSNPSGASTTMVGSRSNPTMENPHKKRRKGHGRRRNPGGVAHVLGQIALAIGGVVVGTAGVRLADMFIPVSTGWLAAIEAAGGFVLGGIVYYFSPAAGIGVAGSMLSGSGMKLLDVMMPAKPAANATPTKALGLVQLAPGMKLVAADGQQAMARIEFGKVVMVPDDVRALPGDMGRIIDPNVQVGVNEIDDMARIDFGRQQQTGSGSMGY